MATTLCEPTGTTTFNCKTLLTNCQLNQSKDKVSFFACTCRSSTMHFIFLHVYMYQCVWTLEACYQLFHVSWAKIISAMTVNMKVDVLKLTIACASRITVTYTTAYMCKHVDSLFLCINFAIVPQGKGLQYTTHNIYFVSPKWAITSQERNLNNILENNHQQKIVEEKKTETKHKITTKIKNWNKNGLGRGLQKKKGRKNALMQRRTPGGKTN